MTRAPHSFAEVVTPAPRAAWEELLDADRHARISQTPQWLDAVCAAAAGKDLSRLYVWRDGRRMVLPVVGRRLRAGSMPQGWGMGGLVSPGPVRPTDAAAVLDDLQRLQLLEVRIRPIPEQAGAWGAAAPGRVIRFPHLTHVLDLRGGFEAVEEQRFSSSTRRNYRKAEREGLHVDVGSSHEHVDVFYNLYLAWSDRRARARGLPVPIGRALARRREPKVKFTEVLRHLGDAARVWIARDGDLPVAAIIGLLEGRHAVAWRATSSRTTKASKYANVLLFRLAIEAACAAGATTFDFGESGGVASLEEFKERFGAVPVSYDEIRIERIPLNALERRRAAIRDAAERLLAPRVKA